MVFAVLLGERNFRKTKGRSNRLEKQQNTNASPTEKREESLKAAKGVRSWKITKS